MFSRFFCFVIFVLICSSCFAQRTVKTQASYTYYVPENTTIEQAKLIALDRAKIQAIADVFGTLVTQSNTTFVSNKNGESISDFQSFGGSDVKGEWIETIGEPQFDIKYVNNQMVVQVTVSGRIREITTSQIDLITQVLCNGTTEKFERSDFKDGDDLFLRFKSPVNGFLTVYLVDASNKTAYCLLPYQNSSEVAQPIKKDNFYLFFSQKEAPAELRYEVDEYTMTCSEGQERNDLYIIFSPNSFAKANSETVEELRPRQLVWDDFQKWLAKIRKQDNDVSLKTKVITISK